MEKVIDVFKLAFAAVGAAFIWFMGGWDKWLMALLIFATIDILTGLLKAFLKKSDKSETGGASSQAMGKGIGKKVFMFFLVGVAAVAGKLIGDGQGIIRSLVISYYVATEALSIIENALMCGIPIPDKLKSVFEVMKNKTGTVSGTTDTTATTNETEDKKDE